MDSKNVLLLITIVALTVLLFLMDIYTPLGVAVWLPYVAIVLLSVWLPARWQTYTTATACSCLILVELFRSPPGEYPFWTAAVNRFLGIFVLWTTAAFGLAARRTHLLQEANRQLQQEIAQRERLQAQLLRTQRLESVGILASGIAHDFNNLLTPILMAGKLLREPRPDEERQRLLDTLQASAARGAEMVRQLLAFAGGANVPKDVVHLGKILQEVKTILDHTFSKAIRIEVTHPPDLQPVLGDGTQLAQVIMNLCVNARDAMPDGGTLTITAANVTLTPEDDRFLASAPPGNYVALTVADTGDGIPSETLDQIFDPFFTTKAPGLGSGLGLSTALGIIRSHNGFIDVASTTGAGTRFAVYLPTHTPERIAEPNTQARDRVSSHGQLIMVVDDEAFILETAKATLEGHGYRVCTASSGADALTLYEQNRAEIEAVIVDIMMPAMDGMAVIESLRRRHPRARIIASSGLPPPGRLGESATFAQRKAGLGAGAQAFLPKPYTAEQVLAMLAEVLSEPQRSKW